MQPVRDRTVTWLPGGELRCSGWIQSHASGWPPVKTRETKPQMELENSHQQFANVWGAFAVEGVPAGEPVLLVDDLVDSRWTLTIAGATLLQAGSGLISPFVLAKSVSDEAHEPRWPGQSSAGSRQ